MSTRRAAQKKPTQSPQAAEESERTNDGASRRSQPSIAQPQPSEKVKSAFVTIPKASRGSPQASQSNGKPSSFMDSIDMKRTKERQIRFVVERVSLWRKLYNGVELGNGETVRYSLEDSAKLVGISKKSLDDYLLQLRFGRMYGFDFLKHQCDNIGVLRKFVREHKQKQKRVQQRQANERDFIAEGEEEAASSESDQLEQEPASDRKLDTKGNATEKQVVID